MRTNDKVKYLEMIQDIIKRMANNSFLLKGWTVTLVSGIFALSSAKDGDILYFLVANIPILVFWGLDSYYLLQERLYRVLYDTARTLNKNNIDFSMKTTKVQSDSFKNCFWHCFFSRTEMWFYLPLIFVCVIVAIILSRILF